MSKTKKPFGSLAKKYNLLEEFLNEEPLPGAPVAAAPPAAPAVDPMAGLDMGAMDPTLDPTQQPNGQPKEITLDSVVERLNVIRGGKSLKDPQVYTELNSYFTSLPDQDRQQLFGFLTKISQIITGTPGEEQMQQPGAPVATPPEDMAPVAPAAAPMAPPAVAPAAPAAPPAAAPVNVT